MKTYSFYLDEKMVERLDRAAGFFGDSRSECVAAAINNYIRDAENYMQLAEQYAQYPGEDQQEAFHQDRPAMPHMVKHLIESKRSKGDPARSYPDLFIKFMEGSEQ